MSHVLTDPNAPEAGELILPPGIHPSQTPITSEKRIRRIRKQPATVGFVDDEIASLAKALLVQYGPLAQAIEELMVRQMAFEDFCTGECDVEELKARIQSSRDIAQERVRQMKAGNSTSDAPAETV